MRLRAPLSLLVWLSCLARLACAHEQHPFVASSDNTQLSRPPRVAVVGAGAAGSFATFWLGFLARRNATLACNVTLIEKTDRIGGRSTTVAIPAYPEQPPLELGASIFVPANKNLWKAARVFNLSLQEGHGGGSLEEGFAIWNGEDFVFEEARGSSYYWNIAKLLWRYGRAPLQVRSLVQQAIQTFVAIYSPWFQALGPFTRVDSFAAALNFTRLYQQSIDTYFAENGVSRSFRDDFVGAAVRVNYGQTPSNIHAVDGLVSLAAAGATSVVGGNWQIFERFVAESDSAVRLQTPVSTIARLDGGQGWLVENVGVFDAVIIAAPVHLSGIGVVGTTMVTVPKQDYVRLHVTLLLTTAPAPNGGFFIERLQGKPGPRTVMSTFAESERGNKRRPRINSMNYLREVEPGVWAVKTDGSTVFSEREVTEELLEELFGAERVTWIHRRVWNAYPRATPMQADEFASFELAPQLYYASAFEPLVSTMETSTVAGANAANLLLKHFFSFRSDKSWAEWDP